MQGLKDTEIKTITE